MEIKVGRAYSYNGQRVVVTKEWNDHTVEVCDGEKFGVALKAHLKPLTNQFHVGQRVRSQGTMTGVVVGIEQDTKMIVVRSDKLDAYSDKNVRYAYDPEKLLPVPVKVKLQKGNRYHVNGKIVKFMVCYDAKSDSYALLNCLSNCIEVTGLSQKMTMDELAEHGIYTIKEAE